jgi:DNA (cytosine-5)-methyltransferase 1
MGYQPWRPARDIIDWSIPGTSIFDRKKPLVDATIRRIAAGIEKYWQDYAKPFLTVLYGSNTVRSLVLPLPTGPCSGRHHAIIEPMLLGQHSCAAARPIDQPVPTVATAGAISLIQPFITRYHGDHQGQRDGDNRNHGITRPLPNVDTSNRYGLVEPLLVEYHGTSKPYPVSLPVKTITTKDRFALMEAFLIDNHTTGTSRETLKPIQTLTTKGWFGLIEGDIGPMRLDIRFRMLKNHELSRAHSFSDDYIFKGNITEVTKQIGNSVPVETSKALALSAFGDTRG